MKNLVADNRTARQWSQADLARRTGIPRTTISAIELGRIDPGVSTALTIASVFKLTVEDLFPAPASHAEQPVWLTAPREGARLWAAEIAGRIVYIPAEPGFGGEPSHNAVIENGALVRRGTSDAAQTLVIAGCDPSLGLLSALLAPAGIRVLILQRSSTAALELLRNKQVHIAGVHWGAGPRGNASIVRKNLGTGWNLLRTAGWEAGLALAPTLRLTNANAVLHASLRWVGREQGSGARRCTEKMFAGVGLTPRFKHLAQDHRGVAEAIRAGWAQTGVCIRYAAEAAQLKFIACETENVDLCFAAADAADPRLAALLNLYQSRHFRRLLGDLPGYHVESTGSVAHV